MVRILSPACVGRETSGRVDLRYWLYGHITNCILIPAARLLGPVLHDSRIPTQLSFDPLVNEASDLVCLDNVIVSLLHFKRIDLFAGYLITVLKTRIFKVLVFELPPLGRR